MDLVDLVQLVFAWEKREQRQYLKEHTAHSPDVHFVVVITFS